MNIHPSAIIDPAAQLGDAVTVAAGAVVEAGAVVGAGTVIGPRAVVMGRCVIGRDVRIHAGAVIGDIPQDLGFKDVESRVVIGDRVTLREGVTIHRGTQAGSVTTLGDDCYLMANSHVAHNSALGRKIILANGVLLAGYVTIGDGAFISGNAVIHQFCRIGRLAMVGGLSGISKDVPPFCMTRSVSLNTVNGLNVVGLRRNGFSPDQRRAVKACFDLLYRNGLNVGQAVAAMRERADDALAAEWADFIAAARRGICKGPSRTGSGGDDDDA
jgi:UDP-N-acetylglucosamine acyltransferase